MFYTRTYYRVIKTRPVKSSVCAPGHLSFRVSFLEREMLVPELDLFKTSSGFYFSQQLAEQILTKYPGTQGRNPEI